jgi:uncharacterized protein (UPF0276 family)
MQSAPLTLTRSPERSSPRLHTGEGLRAGVGLRAIHHAEIVASGPNVGWFEAHSENYFARGGALPRLLGRIRERYPLSLHGVGLSIGSTDPLDRTHLASIGRLVHDFEPMFVSEHLSWSSSGGRFTNDLLPMPYTEESLRHMADRVRQVQDFLGRQILIENVSSYLRFAVSTIPEWDFLAALAHESGCGILLDVNNVYVSAVNHGFDALSYLKSLPRAAVQEIHLAGHSVRVIDGREVRIDTHDAPVCDAVWQLYGAAVDRFGHVPTLIEWDSNIPSLDVLAAEAHKADRMREARHARAA